MSIRGEIRVIIERIKSLDVFCNKFSNRIGSKYVVHTKDYKWENGIYYIPMYMVPFFIKIFLETYIFIRQQVVKDVE